MAWGTPTDIGSNNTGGVGTTIAVTTTGAVPAGGKIFLGVAWFDGTPGVTISGTSGGGLTWRTDMSHPSTAGLFGASAIVSADAPAGLASSTTITVTFGASVTTEFLTASYATGGLAGNTAYGAISRVDTTTWTSGLVTVLNGDLLISVSHWEDSVGATDTPSGGNSEIHDITTGAGAAFTDQYQIGTGASINGAGTWSPASAANGVTSGAVAYTVGTATSILPAHLPWMPTPPTLGNSR